MKITAAIITKNEEREIGRTIDSLKFVDNILIVDSGSTDETITLAKKAGAKVLTHVFTGYSDQRNYADSCIDSGWILSLDADMVVPEPLAREIADAIAKDHFDAFLIGRTNIIWGKKIIVADWGPQDDNHIWLYKKGVGEWRSTVHEEFVTDSSVGQLKNSFVHYNYDTVSEFIEKMNLYSDLASKKDERPSWFSPIIDFGKRYFYKLGFLAGYHGLFLSYLQAIYYVTLKVKLWRGQYT